MPVSLRPLADHDLDAVFLWEQDAAAIRMAVFTRGNPSDRAAFDAHYVRVRSNPGNDLLAILDDGVLSGTVGSYPMNGERELTYWIDPARWGRGIASEAVRQYLMLTSERPLHARVAQHNVGSARVLERAGFERYGEERSFVRAVDRDVTELLYRLA